MSNMHSAVKFQGMGETAKKREHIKSITNLSFIFALDILKIIINQFNFVHINYARYREEV